MLIVMYYYTFIILYYYNSIKRREWLADWCMLLVKMDLRRSGCQRAAKFIVGPWAVLGLEITWTYVLRGPISIFSKRIP